MWVLSFFSFFVMNRNVILIGQVGLNLHGFVIIIKHGLKLLKDNKSLMKKMIPLQQVVQVPMALIKWNLLIKMIILINLVTMMEVCMHLILRNKFIISSIDALDGRDSPDVNHWNSINSGGDMDIDR